MTKKSKRQVEIQGRERPDGLSSSVKKIEGRWFGDACISLEGLELKLIYFGINEHHGSGAFPVHAHPFMELFYTLLGQGEIACGDRSHKCEEGGAYFSPQATKHSSSWNLKKPAVWRGLLFQFDVNLDPERLSHASDLTLVEQFAPFYTYFTLQQHPYFQLPQWAQNSLQNTVTNTLALMQEHPAVGSARVLELWIEIISLISICLRDSGKNDSHGLVLHLTPKEQQLLLARQMLQDESPPEPDIQELAKRIGMSEYHFIREFHQKFGVSPQKYRQNLRMERAAKLLVQTDLPVYEVAEQIHYSSSGPFSKAFRKHTGMSPQAYRSQWTRIHD